jgi:hypothetical protein
MHAGAAKACLSSSPAAANSAHEPGKDSALSSSPATANSAHEPGKDSAIGLASPLASDKQGSATTFCTPMLLSLEVASRCSAQTPPSEVLYEINVSNCSTCLKRIPSWQQNL